MGASSNKTLGKHDVYSHDIVRSSVNQLHPVEPIKAGDSTIIRCENVKHY